MLCRVEMPANEQIYARFYRYRMWNTPGNQTKPTLYFSLIILAAGVFMTFGMGVSPFWLVAFVAMVVIFFGYTLYIKPVREFRSKAGAALNTETYMFTEQGFTRSVRSEEGGQADNLSSQYDVLVGVVETAKDFYLFTGKTKAYLVDKAYFTKGSPEELRSFFEKRLGKKFKGK